MNSILKKYNFNKDNNITYKDINLFVYIVQTRIDLEISRNINYKISDNKMFKLEYIDFINKHDYKNENDYVKAVDKMLLFLIKKYMKNYLRTIKYKKLMYE